MHPASTAQSFRSWSIPPPQLSNFSPEKPERDAGNFPGYTSLILSPTSFRWVNDETEDWLEFRSFVFNRPEISEVLKSSFFEKVRVENLDRRNCLIKRSLKDVKLLFDAICNSDFSGRHGPAFRHLVYPLMDAAHSGNYGDDHDFRFNCGVLTVHNKNSCLGHLCFAMDGELDHIFLFDVWGIESFAYALPYITCGITEWFNESLDDDENEYKVPTGFFTFVESEAYGSAQALKNAGFVYRGKVNNLYYYHDITRDGLLFIWEDETAEPPLTTITIDMFNRRMNESQMD